MLVKIGGLELRTGAPPQTAALTTLSEKMPDSGLPGPSPAWVSFMGIPYAPADQAIGDKRTWMAAGKVSNWVDRCVNIITDNALQVPLNLYAGGKKKRTLVEDHPILTLLNRPNPYDMQTMDELTISFFRSVLLRGETLYETVRNRAGQPAELYWISPDQIRKVPDPKTFIRGYIMDTQGGEVKFSPDEIYWWRVFNPIDRYGGLSRIEALRQSINLDVSAASVQQSLYMNGGLARGVFAPDNKDGAPIPEAQLLQLQKDWSEHNSGSGKAHSVGFMGASMKFLDLGMPADEAQWLEARAVARMEICAAFGVPKEIATSEAGSYDNLRSARLSLWQETMAPWLRFRDSKFNSTLVRAWDPDGSKGLFLESDLTQVGALQPDWEDLSREYREDVRMGIRKINEVRRLRGEDRVAWGDGFWAPYSFADMSKGDGTPFPRISETIATQADTTVDPIEPSGNQAQDENVTPDGDLALTPAQATPNLAVTPAGDLDLSKAKRVRVVVTGDERAAVNDRHVRAIATIASNLRQDVQDALTVQRDTIINSLPSKRRHLTDVESVLVSAEGALLRAAQRAATEAGQEAYASAQSQLRSLGAKSRGRKDVGDINLNFTLDNPDAVNIAAQLGARLSGIDETTLAQVRSIIQEGLRRGYSVDQIAAGVNDESYAGISGVFNVALDSRAETIARTETSWAFNQATLGAYDQSAVVDAKEWATGIGCDICDPLDGEVVPTDENFSDGSDAPPAHPNCTCTLLPVLYDTVTDETTDSTDSTDSGDGGDSGEMSAVERMAMKMVEALTAKSMEPAPASAPLAPDHTPALMAVMGKMLELMASGKTAGDEETKAVLSELRGKVAELAERQPVITVDATTKVDNHAAPAQVVELKAAEASVINLTVPVSVEHHDRGPKRSTADVEYDRAGNPIHSETEHEYGE